MNNEPFKLKKNNTVYNCFNVKNRDKFDESMYNFKNIKHC